MQLKKKLIGTINNKELSLSSVKKKCEVWGSAYTYKPPQNRDIGTYEEVDTLEPGKGYWVYAYSSCVVGLE